MRRRTWGLTEAEWECAAARLSSLLCTAAVKRATVTYGEAAHGAFNGRFSARSGALMDLLGEVDERFLAEHGVMIATLVVRADTRRPGDGYFRFAADALGADVSDRETYWATEASRTWSAFSHGGTEVTAPSAAGLLAPAGDVYRCAMSWARPELLATLLGRSAEDPPAALIADAATALGLDLVFVPAEEPWASEAVAALADAGVSSAWAVAGPLGRVAAARGWSPMLRLVAEAPGELAYALSEALHEALDEVRAGVRAGAHVLVVADDLAAGHSWLVSPDYALEVVVPLLHTMVAESTGLGRAAIFHSDGDTRAIYPALARAGFSAIHPGGADGDDLDQAVEAASASGMTVLGGLAARALIAQGADAPGSAAGRLAASGSLVVCDDGGMSTPDDLAAFAAGLRIARRRWVSETGRASC